MKSAAMPRAAEALCTTALKGRGKQRNSESLSPRVVYAVSCYVYIQLAKQGAIPIKKLGRRFSCPYLNIEDRVWYNHSPFLYVETKTQGDSLDLPITSWETRARAKIRGQMSWLPEPVPLISYTMATE